jgi:CxxC motif-containing protein
MLEKLTCIMCPLGCEMDVQQNAAAFELTGNKCEKGITFAREEILDPRRNLATSVPIPGKDFKMLSVRLSERVHRELLFPILREIATLRPTPPIVCGAVFLPNVLGTGVDVIATRTVR